MISAFIKLELHTRWQGAWVRIYLSFLIGYVIIACLSLLLMQYRGLPLPIDDTSTGRHVLVMIALVETALVLGLSPLLTLNTIVSEDSRHALLPALLSPLRSIIIVVGKLALPCMLMLAAMVASTLPLLLSAVVSEHVTVTAVLATRSLLLMFGLGGMALGICGSALWRDVYTAAGMVYLIIVCVGGSVILAGPLIARLANAGVLIHLVVWINPFVAMAAALDLDLLRTEWLYVLSPLGQRPIVYPTWYGVGLGYLLASVMLIAASTWRIASLRRNVYRWRLSDRR